MKFVLTAVLAAGLTTVALADEVMLKNGRTLVGIARTEGPRVVVETRLGDIGFPKEEVRSIVPGQTPIHEYQERLQALGDSPQAADTFALAMWAHDQGLVRYVNGLLQKTIDLEPNHAEARKLLGFVKYGDCWVTSRDYDAVMAVENRHRAAKAKPTPTVPVRRVKPRVEETPYQLGIPAGPPRRGSQNHGDSGGSYLWTPLWWGAFRTVR